MAYSIVRTEKLLTVTVTGVVSDEEFMSCVDQVREIAGQSPDIHELVDLREVTNFVVSAKTIRSAASAPPRFGPASRQAALVSNDIGFGLSRMYGMLIESSRPNVAVFRDMEEALRWVRGSG